jgi:hypothetical protein
MQILYFSVGVVAVQPIYETANKNGQLQVIMWLCAWHTSSFPQAVQ